MKYYAVREFSIGTTTYVVGDEVTGLSATTLIGLTRSGFVVASPIGSSGVGRITAGATAPANPATNDLWLDTSA